jgi:pimeloyl-ACP methyl ester carboxylesterase
MYIYGIDHAIHLTGGRRHEVWFRSGDGPALVFLHGLFGVTGDEPLFRALARHHSVTAPLAPGFANLAELDDLHDIHDLALYYDDIFDALGLDQVTVVGNSFGAMIAAELAAHVPHRVSRLVLISPIGLWNDAYPVADLWGVPTAEMPKLLYADPSKALGLGPNPGVEAVVAQVRGMTSVARFLWPIPDRGLSRRLRRVRAPTQIIHGEQDRFVPVQYAHDFASLISGASVHIIPGAGHMLTDEALDPLLQAIETPMEVRA